MPRIALIAGATGLVGRQLLHLLQEDREYSEIIVISRDPISSANEKVIQNIISFDQLNKYKDKLKAHDYFCCLGTTMKQAGSKENFHKVDFIYPRDLALIAAEYNARSFTIVSAMGADKDSFVYYNKVKGQIEEAISSLNIRMINIIRPSLILGKRKQSRPMERFGQFIGDNFPFLFNGILRKYKPIEAETIAKGMLKVAKQNISGRRIIESNELAELGV